MPHKRNQDATTRVQLYSTTNTSIIHQRKLLTVNTDTESEEQCQQPTYVSKAPSKAGSKPKQRPE